MTITSVKTGVQSNSFLNGNEALIPGFELLSTQVVGSGGASQILLNSIPQEYRTLRIIHTAKTARATAADDIVIQFNGDTSSGNYVYYHYMYGTHSSSEGSGSALTGIIAGGWAGTATAQNLTSTTFGTSMVSIRNYAVAGRVKVLRATSTAITASDLSTGSVYPVHSSMWYGTSPITSIRLYSTYANISEGSVFSFYGER